MLNRIFDRTHAPLQPFVGFYYIRLAKMLLGGEGFNVHLKLPQAISNFSCMITRRDPLLGGHVTVEPGLGFFMNKSLIFA